MKRPLPQTKNIKFCSQKKLNQLTKIVNLNEHFTGLFQFNAWGCKIKPTIILPQPEELRLQSLAICPKKF